MSIFARLIAMFFKNKSTCSMSTVEGGIDIFIVCTDCGCAQSLTTQCF
jgi:hypothetical protein